MVKLRLKSTHKIKLCPQKSLKNVLRFNALKHHLPSKKESFDSLLLKELRRSDFLFDGGYVRARVPLLSTSKKKRNKGLNT